VPAFAPAAPWTNVVLARFDYDTLDVRGQNVRIPGSTDRHRRAPGRAKVRVAYVP